MSIVHKPESGHHCAPGWTTKPIPPGKHPGIPDGATVQCIPPRDSAFPQGAVWECDGCGRTWVVRPRYDGQPGIVNFRAERRFERWLRERKARRQQS
jgi:hypothetical protein